MTPRPTSFTWIIDLHPPRCPASPRPFLALRPLTHTHNNRKFATHRDRPTASSSTNVNDRLNPRASLGASSMTGGESVGPFPLGVGPSGRNKTWKTWRELGLGGKRRSSCTLGMCIDGGDKWSERHSRLGIWVSYLSGGRCSSYWHLPSRPNCLRRIRRAYCTLLQWI